MNNKQFKIMVIIMLVYMVGVLWAISSHAGTLRCGNEIVQEGDMWDNNKCNLNEYTVNNQNADIVIAKDKYGQEIEVIDGRIVSIGR